MQFITSWLATKFSRKFEKKQVVSHYNYTMALIKHRYSPTPIPYPHNSTIHAIPYFCGPKWRSFPVRDHLRSNLGTICGPGSFAALGSFADPYRTHPKKIAFFNFITIPVMSGQFESPVNPMCSQRSKTEFNRGLRQG